jgi:O-antigen ligase
MSGPPRLALAAAAALLASTAAVVVTLGPTAAILMCLLVVVLALCVRAPAYAFALSLALYSFEGTVKMRLSVEDAPSPVALGAAALDLAFLASLAALLLSDRGRSLLALWDRATRLERVAATLLGAWLVLSVLQIPIGGDLTNGVEGFRLTHFYVPALLGGIVLAARLGPERLALVLLAAIGLAVLYGGVRGITGPSSQEQLFAEQRALNSSFGELGRNTGSFTGPVGLVSFLVPAALLCLVLAFLRVERRALLALLFALAMTGIVASFVRTALVAVVAGAALMALLLLVQKGSERRRGGIAVAMVVAVLGGGYAATLLAGAVTPETGWRAHSLARPFADYSVTMRFDIWGRTLDKVAEEPLGTGVGTLGRATLEGRRAKFTDNSYLKILQEQGVLGALFFLGGLGGLFVAAAIRLGRAGPSRRPLGTAALVAVSGFLVLMVMGEYVEQPGKLLAWTLLGVALWEARD